MLSGIDDTYAYATDESLDRVGPKMTTKAYLKVQLPKIGCKMGPAQLGEFFSMTSRGPMTAAIISPSAATTKLMGEIGFASENYFFDVKKNKN